MENYGLPMAQVLKKIPVNKGGARATGGTGGTGITGVTRITGDRPLRATRTPSNLEGERKRRCAYWHTAPKDPAIGFGILIRLWHNSAQFCFRVVKPIFKRLFVVC